jgi:hypothetical protein
MAKPTFILRKQALRYSVLEVIYDLAAGCENTIVPGAAIIAKLSPHDTVDALTYLEQERMISFTHRGDVTLLHRGIVEYERSVTHPSEPTEHFPAHVFNGPVAVVQTGSASTASIAAAERDQG